MGMSVMDPTSLQTAAAAASELTPIALPGHPTKTGNGANTAGTRSV